MIKSPIRPWAALGLIVTAVVLLTAACGAKPTSSAFESPPQTPPVASPADSTVEAPTASVLVVLSLPTPTSRDLATVGGFLNRDDLGGASSPLADAQLYLAKVLRGESGTGLLAGFNEKNSPAARTDASGAFAFVSVPPETYALVVSTSIESFIIKTAQGKDFLFEAKGGEVLDLGQVHTDLPY